MSERIASRVVVNADDYAMDPGVDKAILALASRGVVTSVSAMVLSPRWAEAGRPLMEAPVSRGLHLDFTSPFATVASPLPTALPRLMAAAFAGQIDRSAVRLAVERQIDLYLRAVGEPPDFVDGHQHAHQLPILREVLVAGLRAQFGTAAAQRVGLRICAPRRWRGPKAAVIAACGASALARIAAERGHPVNTDFAGVYDFSPGIGLPALWRGWLGGLVGARPLIMCHVAAEDAPPSGPPDPIRRARIAEWRWLGSGSFTDLCARSGVELCSWTSAGEG